MTGQGTTALSDRDAILEVIAAYAHAVDDRDVEAVVGCFSDDAIIDFEATAPVSGASAIRRFYIEAFAQPRMGSAGTSTHLMANTVVSIAGDRAGAETSAVAFHAAVGRDTVISRGLRYRDHLVRTAVGWRLARRRHRCVWEAATPGGPVGAAVSVSSP